MVHTYQRSIFCCAQKIHSEGKAREDLEFKREGKCMGLFLMVRETKHGQAKSLRWERLMTDAGDNR